MPQAPPGSSLSLRYCGTAETVADIESPGPLRVGAAINAMGELGSKVSAVERQLGGPLSCHGDVIGPTDRYGRQHPTCTTTEAMH